MPIYICNMTGKEFTVTDGPIPHAVVVPCPDENCQGEGILQTIKTIGGTR